MVGKKVSLIIPFYNTCFELFDVCIDSVINSTYTNIEVIIIDDGSDVSYLKKLDDYASLDARIKILHQDNGGPSSARNNGIKAGTGDYLIFVDSDDYIEKNYIAALVECAENRNSDIVVSNVCNVGGENTFRNNKKEKLVYLDSNDIEITNENLDRIVNAFWMNNKDLIGQVNTNGIQATVWGKLFKRDVIANVLFDEQLKYGEDKIFFYDAVQHCRMISFVNDVFYYHVYREESLMNTIVSRETIDKYECLFEKMGERMDRDSYSYKRKAILEYNVLIRKIIDLSVYTEYKKMLKYILAQKNMEEISTYWKTGNKDVFNSKLFNSFLSNRLYMLAFFARRLKNKYKDIKNSINRGQFDL